MFCEKCGMKLEEGWKVCPACGSQIIHNQPSDEEYAKRNWQYTTSKTHLGKKLFKNEIHICGNQVMIKNEMNTDKCQTPEFHEFSIDDISQINHAEHSYVKHPAKIHYILGAGLFVIGLFSSIWLCCLVGLIIIGLNSRGAGAASWPGMEIYLNDGRKISIHCNHEEEIGKIEYELRRKV